MNIADHNGEILSQRLAAISRAGRRRSAVPPPSNIDFMTNDYLGLRAHPRVVAAASAEMTQYGVGAGASRLLGGSFTVVAELERDLANFKRTEAALVYPSGYSANIGVLSALVREGDCVWSDELNHASIIDGCRLARGTTYVYPHNDIASLTASLKSNRAKHGVAVIVTESVFSMDGDICRLAELVEVAQKHDAILMVDEAHATCVLQPDGSGIFGAAEILPGGHIVMGTLSKALGSQGGFVCCSNLVLDYLVNTSRSFIFSTGIALPCAAAAREALRLFQREPVIFARLHENCRLFASLLTQASIPAEPSTPIFPIIIGGETETISIASELRDRGYNVGAVRPPTVAEGTSRLRVTISARHTPEQLIGLAENLESLLK